MAFATKFKKRILEKKIRSLVKVSGVQRKTRNLSSSKSIGMIFDCTDPELVVHINKFANRLRKEGLRVFQLGFFNSKVEGSFPFPIFNKKELNWYGKPNSANVEEFLERNLDILINAYTVPNSPLEFISKTSGANFRAGIFNENLCDCNDFMISKADGSYELPEGLNSLYSYIKSINGKRA